MATKTNCFSKFICVFIPVLLFTTSCSNWEENPVKADIRAVQDSIDVIHRLSFPERTNKILFSEDYGIISGSSDGKFYRSGDEGKTWQKTGEINVREAINCFLVYNSIPLKKKVIYAGTEEGVYVSEDGGASWKQSLAAAGAGEKIMIYSFETTADPTTKQDSIIAYGWDGKYNKFKILPGGNNWMKEIVSPKIPFKITSKLTFNTLIFPTQPIIGTYTNNLYGCTGGNVIYVYNFKYSINSSITSSTYFYKYLNVGWVYSAMITNNKIFMATNTGILIFDSYTNNLITKCLADYDVRSLTVSNGTMIAGTNMGMFYSTDYGTKWQVMNTSLKPENINEIYIQKNRFYVVTNDGVVKAGSFYDYDSQSLFSPILLEPAMNALVENSSVKFSWKILENNVKTVFCLQISSNPDFKQAETLSVDNLIKRNCSVTGLNPDTQYYWRVLTYNLYKKNNAMQSFSFRTR